MIHSRDRCRWSSSPLAVLTFQIPDERYGLDGVSCVGEGLNDVVLHHANHTEAGLVTCNADGETRQKWEEKKNKNKQTTGSISSHPCFAKLCFFFLLGRNCINFNLSTIRSALWQEKRTSFKLCLVAAEEQKRWMLEPVKMFSNFTVNYGMNELVGYNNRKMSF